MECRSRSGGGNRLSGLTFSEPPIWRAFGPGASRRLAWDAPRDALPRTALRFADLQESHWGWHLGRLQSGAACLGWEVSWLGSAESEITAWISTSGFGAGRLQLLPDVISIRLESIPVLGPSYRLLPLAHPLGDIRNDARAGLKGLLGPWDIQTRNHAQEKWADDALLFWPDGTIAETAMAAVGLQLKGELLVPPPEGRVSSITEAVDLPAWAASRGLAVRRRPIHLKEVTAGQLWCMNAMRGLWQAEVVQL